MLTEAILLMGIATVVLSLIIAFEFKEQSHSLKGHPKRLSASIAWQLIGEAAIGFGTLVFAFAAHHGALRGWSLELQSAIRCVMFAATSGTTLHLFITIRSLTR
jgi:hypothetical protein